MEFGDDLAQAFVLQAALQVMHQCRTTYVFSNLLSTTRYAAEGDANGEPISRNEEGEKMSRLEKEVQDYPGSVFLTMTKDQKPSLIQHEFD